MSARLNALTSRGVVPVAASKHPKEVGHYDAPRFAAQAIHVTGSRAYVGDGEWVRVLDISTPSAPRELAAYETPAYARDVWAVNGKAYIAAAQAGVLVVDFGADPGHVASEQGSSGKATSEMAGK